MIDEQPRDTPAAAKAANMSRSVARSKTSVLAELLGKAAVFYQGKRRRSLGCAQTEDIVALTPKILLEKVQKAAASATAPMVNTEYRRPSLLPGT